MKTAAFRTAVVAKFRLALRRTTADLARLRQASRQALVLCRRHARQVPDASVRAFEKEYRDLWRSR